MVRGLILGTLDCLEVGFCKEKPAKVSEKGQLDRKGENQESGVWKSNHKMHQGREHRQLR